MHSTAWNVTKAVGSAIDSELVGTLCERILAAMPEAVVCADRDGIIRLWNRGAEVVFGYAAVDAVGQSLDIIIPDDLRARHWEGYQQAIAAGAHPSRFPGAARTCAAEGRGDDLRRAELCHHPERGGNARRRAGHGGATSPSGTGRTRPSGNALLRWRRRRRPPRRLPGPGCPSGRMMAGHRPGRRPLGPEISLGHNSGQHDGRPWAGCCGPPSRAGLQYPGQAD